jgi:hypothetical protein
MQEGYVNTIYALYGDPAYPQSPYLIGGALSAAGSVKTSWSKSVSGGPPRGGRDVRQDFSTVQSVSFETKNEDLSAPSGKVLHHHRVLIIAMVNGGGRTIAQIAVGQIFGRHHVRGDSRNRDDGGLLVVVPPWFAVMTQLLNPLAMADCYCTGGMAVSKTIGWAALHSHDRLLRQTELFTGTSSTDVPPW